MKSSMTGLNEAQKKAVSFGKGPFLIVAGAGTGKTAVITNRIVHLIKTKQAGHDEILALTFSEKAAAEMEDRVSSLISESYSEIWISTFHAFCEKILHSHGLEIGLPPNFKILDGTAAWILVKKNLSRFDLDYYKPLANPSKFIHALLSHFSRCKDQGMSPEDYAHSGNNAKEERVKIMEIAGAYAEYRQLMLENNCLDFGDLICYTLELFKKRSAILEKFRKKFKFILVDEFQDTNYVQYELVKLLAHPADNLTVCADDDQAIYRWRGASFGNVLQFQKDFPKLKKTVLSQNYRSRQEILDAAYHFIQKNNPNRLEAVAKISKKLKSEIGRGGEISFFEYENGAAELQATGDLILKLTSSGANFGEIAILARTNETAASFSKHLEKKGIPQKFISMKGLYSKPAVMDAMNYFRFLINPFDGLSLAGVISSPALNLPLEEIAKITNFRYQKGIELYEALKNHRQAGVDEESSEKIASFLEKVKKHAKQARFQPVSEIYISFLEEFGYLLNLAKTQDKNGIEIITQFHERMRRFEEGSLNSKLQHFVEEINLETESGEEGEIRADFSQSDAVKIMTVHSAKGLEFKYVFLVGVAERRFPSTDKKEQIEIPEDLVKEKTPEGDVHLQEERRLFYVALTRAKQACFISSAKDYGGIRPKKISQFISEADIPVRVGQSPALKAAQKIEPVDFVFQIPEYFSYTQLKTFKNCPLQYKFGRILKFPVPKKSFFIFGETMHNTLYKFMLEYRKQKMSLKELLDIYRQEWKGDWYGSQAKEKTFFQKGEIMLRDFYARTSREKPAILDLGGEPCLEQGFLLKVGQYSLRGKIDRIDAKPSGKIEIIDYKTGKGRDKLSSEDKTQLIIYQMAVEESLGLEVEKLTYYFLEEDKQASFRGTDLEKEKEKEKILSEISKIEKGNFEPSPGFACKMCDFRNICEYRKT